MPTYGTQKASSAKWQLALGTISFTVCFAAWGLISAFAPRFRESFHLSATQTAFLVAVPVLLGSLMRIVTGMLADRFGGRLIFTLLMMTVAVPAFLVPRVGSYQNEFRNYKRKHEYICPGARQYPPGVLPGRGR